MGKSFIFAIEDNGNERFADLPTIEEQINNGRQILNETQPDFFFNPTRPDNTSNFKYVSEDSYNTLLSEGYNEIYNLLKHGSNTVEVLAENVTNLNLEENDLFFNLYDRNLQIDSLAWTSAGEDYRSVDLGNLVDTATGHFKVSKTDEELVAKEVNQKRTEIDCVKSSLNVLGEDEDDFWSMIEAGIGTAMDFSESVEFVKNWIEQNGTWEDKLPLLKSSSDISSGDEHSGETSVSGDRSFTIEVDHSAGNLLELGTDQEELETVSAEIEVNASAIEENNLSTLNNEITISYSIIKKSDCEHKVYFYAVDDINGNVEGLAPTESGYVEAALNNIIFPIYSNNDNKVENGSLQFDAGSLIVPLVIEGGTLTQAKNGEVKVYFSYAGASGGDGLDHIKLIDGNVFCFNSLIDSNENHVNEIIIKLDNNFNI